MMIYLYILSCPDWDRVDKWLKSGITNGFIIVTSPIDVRMFFPDVLFHIISTILKNLPVCHI